ncbi:MAG TPA: GrpB family protein [Pyrinomonadaceae bacterium]|nr:GrpB family protein [Pyrinomonadaceae bacterium]
MRIVVVVDYDRSWPEIFERLRSHIWPILNDLAIAVEHVGSTSVPGLAAKPIIDMTVVVPTEANIPVAIERLVNLGYMHRGNLGVEGREVFHTPDELPAHHLYLCRRDSLALRNHLVVRDYLRTHPEIAREYGELKKRLAKEFPHDIESYIDGKTDLILKILLAANFPTADLDVVEYANRKAG